MNENGNHNEMRHYTVVEAAKVLGISQATAYRYVRQHILPCHLIGKRRVVTQEDIDEYLRGRRY